jgi:peptidylprolyl isomerase domain and WD repeat-containing protein 1
VKFWKKVFHLVEFSKHFRAHTGFITCAALSDGHDRMITVSPADKTVKIFDVMNQDLLDMLKLGFQPYACEFVEINDLRMTYIFVSDSNSGSISVIDEGSEEKDKVIKVLNFHAVSVR